MFPRGNNKIEDYLKIVIMVMDIEQMADNTTNIKDQFLYTGFIDQDLENESGLGTYDFGETLVMISPLGTFYGYSTTGAVEEVIDQEAIDNLVAEYNTNPISLHKVCISRFHHCKKHS